LKKSNQDKLKSEITIKLTFDNETLAKSIEKATAPENQETPKNITATSDIKNNEMHIKIKSEDSIKDLLTTVEDYLEKIDLSYKTIKSLKKN
jgi:tRNA threonylcarbamoyladenosine modification (KEOPS) complex  Pcc1 subunit